jgi:Flp pilus assembly protein TadG
MKCRNPIRLWLAVTDCRCILLARLGTQLLRADSVGRLRVRQHACNECGATIVETAISFSLLICSLLGAFQIALALYTYHFVSDAAREATRYAIVRGSTSCSNTPNLANCNATAAVIQAWVRNLGYPGINPNNLTVTTTWPTTGANCYPSTSPCNNPSNLVNVAVNYVFPLNVPYWKTGSINIVSSSQMVISQ